MAGSPAQPAMLWKRSTPRAGSRGRPRERKDYVQFTNRPVYGKLRYTLSYEDTAPNFDNQLGYNPELNRRGEAVRLSQYNQFDKGLWRTTVSEGRSIRMTTTRAAFSTATLRLTPTSRRETVCITNLTLD